MDILDAVLADMPDDLREVLVLAEIEEQSAPEVAAMLEIPIGTVASRLRRAREAFTKSARRVRARLGVPDGGER
jgi:RNA polymerase sigma-70 factor (ECF subfamily)